jgi:hypothetical protein
VLQAATIVLESKQTWQVHQQAWERADQLRELWLTRRQEMAQYSAYARLQARMISMPVIEQAKGIMMAQCGWTADEAFDALRKAARRSGVRVRDLAATIVNGTVRSVLPSPAGLARAGGARPGQEPGPAAGQAAVAGAGLETVAGAGLETVVGAGREAVAGAGREAVGGAGLETGARQAVAAGPSARLPAGRLRPAGNTAVSGDGPGRRYRPHRFSLSGPGLSAQAVRMSQMLRRQDRQRLGHRLFGVGYLTRQVDGIRLETP